GHAAAARQKEVISGLGGAIDDFLDHLGEQSLSHSAYERLNAALNVERILEGLSETLAELTRAVIDANANSATLRLTDSVIEGLDAILLTVIDAMGPDGGEDRALLGMMGGDRGALMRRLREAYLADDAGLSAADKMGVLTITNLT